MDGARPLNGNCMAVSRVLSPHVARVAIANPLQVQVIAHAHVKTDRIDAGTLASLQAAGYLPEIWTPDAGTERLRRLVARRHRVVRHRTRVENEVHSILHAHLIPKCPHADLFNRPGREWLARQPLPDDEREAIFRHVRELDRLGEDLAALDRTIAEGALEDASIHRLLTITGVNLAVAAGLMAAIGDIARFDTPQKLVSYFGLNPRVRQSGLGAAHHGRIGKVGRSHVRAMLVEAAWAAAKAPGPLARLLHPDPGETRPPGRGGRRRPQAHRALLAHADQGAGLSLGAAEPRGAEAPGDGAARRAAAVERQRSRICLCLQRQGVARSGSADRRTGREGLRAVRGGLAAASTQGSDQAAGGSKHLTASQARPATSASAA